MLKLNPIKPNMTEIETDKYLVLFSYKTPVVYFDKTTSEYHKTIKTWSKTTTTHINQWLNNRGRNKEGAYYITQSVLDSLL